MKIDARHHLPDTGAVDRRRRGVLGLVAVMGLLPALATKGATPAPAVPAELAGGGAVAQAARRAEICSTANAQGVGLRGEYFPKEALRDAPMLTRVDAVVDFDAHLDLPRELSDAPPRSARWKGWVRPLTTGRYLFHATTPEMRVTIGRELVAGGAATQPIGVEMSAGRFYPVSVEVDKLPLAAESQRVRLEWTAPHGARFLVPRALLYLPTDTVQSGPS